MIAAQGGEPWIVTELQPLPDQRYDCVLPLVTVHSTMQPCRTRVGGNPPTGIHIPQPTRWYIGAQPPLM